MHYTGRFAPSPSGPLHAGSLVAAMASYLDARAHQGTWLVRIEDIDEGRTVAGAADHILQTLTALGMQHDGPVWVQSARKERYAADAAQLGALLYPCGCTRREIADSQTGRGADGTTIYPGTCRNGLAAGRTARSWRLRVPDAGQANEHITFTDRWLGPQSQHLATEAGDFTLRRADGFWAYQLAVVVDDADQQVTHIVRGEDLLGSTARQIYLQRLLGVTTPAYLHVPLVRGADGEKFSKQNNAPALDMQHPITELQQAALRLGLPHIHAEDIPTFWQQAIPTWQQLCAQKKTG